MIENPGSLLLYRAASGLERSMADADAERLIALEAELIRDVWDPYRISTKNLPFLSWAMGVPLWETSWHNDTRREWTAVQWHFKALRGTEAGIAMALDYAGRDSAPGPNGYELLQVIAPPQGFYAAPRLTAEQWNIWVRRMPELRIKLTEGVAFSTGDEWFCNDGYIGVMGSGLDNGPALYGRRAILRRNGVDQQLQISQFTWTSEIGEVFDVERVSIPGIAGVAFMAGDSAVGEDHFIDGEELAAIIYTFRVDSTYERNSAELQLGRLIPGFEPLSINYERNSDVRDGGPFFFVNDFASDGYADSDRVAGDMLADRIYLNDPEIAAPMMQGVSFAGVDRVGSPKYQAELLVDLRTTVEEDAFIVDESYVDDSYTVPEDLTDMDRAMRAVSIAKAFRDRVLVSFETTIPIEFHDPVTENTRFGNQVRATL